MSAYFRSLPRDPVPSTNHPGSPVPLGDVEACTGGPGRGDNGDPSRPHPIMCGGRGTRSNFLAREKVDRILREATWTARPPSFEQTGRTPKSGLQPPSPDRFKESPWWAGRAEAARKGGGDDPDTRASSAPPSPPPPGALQWSTNDRWDYAFALRQLLRSASHDVTSETSAKRSVETEFVQIPLSWYRHVQRDSRGSRRPDLEAIQILAFVVMKYVTGAFAGDLLHVPRGLLCELFGMADQAERDAVNRLLDRRLLVRVIVRGYVPWEPRKRGTYRYLIPRFDETIGITYRP